MMSSSRSRSRSALPLMVGMLLAALSLVVAPAAASAHDVLVESSPAGDSVVETLPAELVLTFSANLIDGPQATQIEITTPDGRPAHAGEPVVAGAVVTMPLITEAPAGVYQVMWRVVSSDTHPISGGFSFEVLSSTEPSPAPSTEPSPAPPTVTPPLTSENPSEGTPGDLDSLWRNLPFILGMLAFVALAGAVLSYLAARHRRKSNEASDEG